jgi:hypothetical protein
MRHRSTVLGACAAAQAAEGMASTTFSLRAAEEPDAKEWAQGYQRADIWFLRLPGGAYSDHVRVALALKY